MYQYERVKKTASLLTVITASLACVDTRAPRMLSQRPHIKIPFMLLSSALPSRQYILEFAV